MMIFVIALMAAMSQERQHVQTVDSIVSMQASSHSSSQVRE
jgi:hypothetical protein